jgi:dTDP-4-dehydrorhamnose 3,5-epimerase
MEIIETAIPELRILVPQRIGDARGFFSEVWNKRDLAAVGIDAAFVQDNHARNGAKGTLRGLHFQVPPHAQGKLLRVVRGAIFDVAVDIRRGSPSFGQVVTGIVSAANWHQIWIPPGFAHGYCTIENDTEVVYKVTDFYSAAHDRGIAWNDPDLAITWPFAASELLLSPRDRAHPRLCESRELFDFAAHAGRNRTAERAVPEAAADSA